MELAIVFVNFGLFAVTVVAAIIAWRGVRDAQDARDEAANHETRALDHSRQAAAAATASSESHRRAAEALEESNRREEARDAKRIPWTVEKAGGSRWRVTNNTGGLVTEVTFEPRGDEHVQMEDSDVARDVAAGQPVFIDFGGGLNDPATATLFVEWNDSLDQAQQTVIVLG